MTEPITAELRKRLAMAGPLHDGETCCWLCQLLRSAADRIEELEGQRLRMNEERAKVAGGDWSREELCEAAINSEHALMQMEAKHKRAVTALRYLLLVDGPDFWRECKYCTGKWQVRPDGTESHNPVTINGVTGRCPCDLRGGEG